MFQVPQWQQHTVEQGLCVRCGRGFAIEGSVAEKPAFGAQATMTYCGILGHALPCRKDN